MASTQNVSEVASGAVKSHSVPRKTSKRPKVTDSGLVHVSVMLEKELVESIEATREELRAEDPFKRPFSRTEALRQLLREALGVRAARKK